ncbi:pre-mrna splicing factor cwc24 [Fusarium mexicanum]|uniref:Pre-mRNA-splicing factor CWC24 n=1 Tax=Fusarium mexicanum TaxID=751941 RepID=A0A8H5IC70_9HYPO|nr:pre-mrna splicing factor cwc24 [Fusarium mexicanum]
MAESSTTETAMPAPIAFKQRSRRAKDNVRKRPASTLPAHGDSRDSSSSSSDDDRDAGDRPRIKRNKKGAISASSTSQRNPDQDHGPTAFRANREVPLTDTNDATKRKDWYDEPTPKGPARAASNVRITTTFDFKPDVCKDYNKTGYCGYGDACIYSHVREDIKQGWQLDKEWEDVVKSKKINGSRKKADTVEDEADMEMLDKIPFVCIICEKPYKQPVVTRCGHYFCEACALKRYRKDPTCKNCGAATMGVFNTASKLERVLRRKRENKEKLDGAAQELDDGGIMA